VTKRIISLRLQPALVAFKGEQVEMVEFKRAGARSWEAAPAIRITDSNVASGNDNISVWVNSAHDSTSKCSAHSKSMRENAKECRERGVLPD